MFEKFDHKFKGKKGYNFLITFIGLLFAFFLILPDDWWSVTSFLLTTFFSLLISHFASRNIEQRKKSSDLQTKKMT